MGVPLNKDELREVAELSGVMDGDVFDFIEPSEERMSATTFKSRKSRIKGCN